MIWSKRCGRWTAELLWSYGVGIGVRSLPPCAPYWGRWAFAIELPLVIVAVWV